MFSYPPAELLLCGKAIEYNKCGAKVLDEAIEAGIVQFNGSCFYSEAFQICSELAFTCCCGKADIPFLLQEDPDELHHPAACS
jgi:hypothetical protein